MAKSPPLADGIARARMVVGGFAVVVFLGLVAFVAFVMPTEQTNNCHRDKRTIFPPYPKFGYMTHLYEYGPWGSVARIREVYIYGTASGRPGIIGWAKPCESPT